MKKRVSTAKLTVMSDLDFAVEQVAASAALVGVAAADLNVAATYGELEVLRRLVGDLQLAAIEQFRMAGLSYAEIAEPLGVTRQSVFGQHKKLSQH